jgi:phosphoribosylformimino-5-aminoimidazole carboxamide ribotide isomerase
VTAPLRIVGVLDLQGGRAVHARGGRREGYRPIQSAAGVPIAEGDALELARAYIERCHLHELYLADLDAIQGRPPQDDLVDQIASVAPLWVDGGVTLVEQARRLAELKASHVIVGLETMRSFAALEDICRAVGGGRVAFSVDVKDGRPLLNNPARDASIDRMTLDGIVERATGAGVGALILLDLARVGSRAGPPLALVRVTRRAASRALLFAGGGVRGAEDLAQLSDEGCDGALVATALLDGTLTPDDVDRYSDCRRDQAKVVRHVAD